MKKVTPQRSSHFRVSYQLLDSDNLLSTGHCLGVNDVLVSGTQLLTGGRDSFIHSWDLAGPSIPLVGTYAHHSHWVNQLCVCTPAVIASCSSDTTVKLWKTPNQVKVSNEGSLNQEKQSTTQIRAPLCTLESHTDYVSCISYNEPTNTLYSASFDKTVAIWDIEHALEPIRTISDETTSHSEVDNITTSEVPYSRRTNENVGVHKGSIYSLATCDSLIVTGGTEHIIRGWDPRSRECAFKFRGHRDIIRDLLISADGTKIISASSDLSIKLWDTRERKCIKTYSIHDDSVWSLSVDQSFSRLFSAGRDGNVFLTDLSTAQSSLLVKRDSPVLKVYLPPDEESLWLTTPENGNLLNFSFDPKNYQKRSSDSHYELHCSPGSPGLQMLTEFTKSSPAASFSFLQSPIDLPDTCEDASGIPLYKDPSVVLLGQAGIIKHNVLNDRIHILTQDSSNHIVLWNVLTASKEEDIGIADWEETIAARFQEVSIPQWFRVDHTTGVPLIHLDLSQCFNAVIDHSLLGLPKPPPRSNVGQNLLNTLFETWKERKEEQEKADKAKNKEISTKKTISTETAVEVNSPPRFLTYNMSKLTPVTISNTNNGRNIFCSTIGGASGSDVLPAWVEDCVLLGIYNTREENKYSFFVKPNDGEELDPLPIGENKLSSLRWLTVRRILSYVVSTLGISLPTTDGEPIQAHEFLELLCKGKVLDYSLDLAAIKTFYWKSGDEIILRYRRAESYLSHPISYSANKTKEQH